MSTPHPVSTREAWIAARRELLAEEKQFTAQREQLSARRRALPWLRLTQRYDFQGPKGPCTLSDLFGERSQLVVYHLMFAPEWDAACTSCSFWADNFERNVVHLAHRDVSFAAISRAPVAKLGAYAARMRWSFPWVSSGESSFNFDFGVSFSEAQLRSQELLYNYGTIKPRRSDLPGISVFYKDADGSIFHTYSCYSRGIDMMNTAYHYLDLVPNGRDEADGIMHWLRRHDEYPTEQQEQAQCARSA
jgi:predicted dithiol-disulfide oxidoreductase (DUF899 family)